METTARVRVLIADDEPLARLRLRALLEELGGCDVVAEAANGKQVLSQCALHAPQVVLLDIGMPGLNGMDAAAQLAKLPDPPLLIFVTAYGEYALDAFEREAADYLLKPVRKDRLDKALQRARSLLQTPRLTPQSHQARTHLSTSLHGSVRLLPLPQVYYFLAEQKYTVVRWVQGQALLDESLKKLEAEFAGQLVRIHRNALAAVAYMERLERTPEGRYFLHFKGIDDTLEVSRRHFGEIKRLMQDFRSD